MFCRSAVLISAAVFNISMMAAIRHLPKTGTGSW